MASHFSLMPFLWVYWIMHCLWVLLQCALSREGTLDIARHIWSPGLNMTTFHGVKSGTNPMNSMNSITMLAISLIIPYHEQKLKTEQSSMLLLSTRKTKRTLLS